MKKTIFNCFFLLLLFTWQGCKEKETLFTNSTTNITTQIKIETEAVRSNPMDKDETWTNSKEFDMRDELKERYGIDLDKNELISFKINLIAAAWNSARCRKLSHIKTDFILPDIDDIHFESRGSDWDLLCSAAGTNALFFNFILVTPQNDPYSIINKDFADAINRGEKITIDYSLTAGEEIEAEGIALSFSLFTVAEFRPK
ncbi:MAG TPA: hypothetical protein ENJ95_00855 [Bacteroidetes bacterium]|nr:hypothetical protein [Bacteroidota bacterium]